MWTGLIYAAYSWQNPPRTLFALLQSVKTNCTTYGQAQHSTVFKDLKTRYQRALSMASLYFAFLLAMLETMQRRKS